jgi:hypothetical protein
MMELSKAINYLENRYSEDNVFKDCYMDDVINTIMKAAKKQLGDEKEKLSAPTEEKEVVRPIRVRMRCSCGGTYEQVEDNGFSITLTTFPPQYPHRCNKCGKIINFPKQYPYIEYEME